MVSEFQYIRWLRDKSSHRSETKVGIGDDAALLSGFKEGEILITTDMLLDGTHFKSGEMDPFQIGRKAMAVNLSDIAAMAGVPISAVISLALPQKQGSSKLAETLYNGMRSVADEFGVDIAGGDTNSWSGGLVINVALIGKPQGRAITRTGAKPGDWLFVTGPLGGSILGKHLDFVPRIREASLLHSRVSLNSMIDISDGLAADLGHICEESGCGAVLWEDRVPISETAQKMGGSALEHALSDGEDFELLFSVNSQDGQKLVREQPIPVFHIGRCIAGDKLWIESAAGKSELQAKGYVHQLS